MPFEFDNRFIEEALRLAQRGKGITQPNPTVGAVLVKNGKIISSGYHKGAGKAHAEVVALRKAKESIKGATLFVTLEPCCHTGRTGPCTEVIINSGIKRVVACTKDPNPLVNGKGFRILKKAGIEVVSNIMTKEARALNEAHFFYYQHKRPMVTLKLAQSLDGRIASTNGDSKYLSCRESLRFVHQLRSENDAVMIGSNTLAQDNPSLNVRYVKGIDPYRIVVGTKPNLNSNLNLLKNNNDHKTIIASTQKSVKNKLIDKFQLTNWIIKENSDRSLNLNDLLKQTDNFGFKSILLEGGSQLATFFLKKKLVDKIILFITPQIIGEGIPAIGELKIKTIAGSLKFKNYEYKKIGTDLMFVGYPDWK